MCIFKKRKIIEPNIREIWIIKSENPFTDKFEVEILDIKSGHIQYKHKGGTIPMSSTIEQFLQCYNKLK